jgi:hypothetical protein
MYGMEPPLLVPSCPSSRAGGPLSRVAALILHSSDNLVAASCTSKRTTLDAMQQCKYATRAKVKIFVESRIDMEGFQDSH